MLKARAPHRKDQSAWVSPFRSITPCASPPNSIATGRASHAWLGVQVSTDMATRGARIVDVTPGSPAAAAGLTPGAVVTKVDDHVITSGYALVATVQSRAPGSAVTLVFTDASGNQQDR